MKADHVEERRRFISDAFHTLNQPLTGLHCGLELALQKPRSEGEYRQRISNGVEYAGEVLALIRAVRQLVDAADPGERFGTIPLGTVLAQVKSELEVLAEASGVTLAMDCNSAAQVKADPAKLAAALGSLIAGEMENTERGGSVRVALQTAKRTLSLRIEVAGNRNNAVPNGAGKIAEIRRNAAVSYLWMLGAQIDFLPNESIIKLQIEPGIRSGSETTKHVSS
jgi:signal transduction histidine kinase